MTLSDGRTLILAATSRATPARRVAQWKLEVRAGLHTGEVDSRGEDVFAKAVIAEFATQRNVNEVRVSEALVCVVAGSGLVFEELGSHALKGVPAT